MSEDRRIENLPPEVATDEEIMRHHATRMVVEPQLAFVVEKLRVALDLPPEVATDEEILRLTEGSFLRASVELDHATRMVVEPWLTFVEKLLRKTMRL